MEMTPKEAYEALRANEKRIQAVIENMPVGLVVFTPEGLIEAVNPYCEWMFGMRAEKLLHCPVTMLFGIRDDAKRIAVSIMEQRLFKVCGCTMQRIDHTSFPAALSLSKFATSDGERYLMSIMDETGRSNIQLETD